MMTFRSRGVRVGSGGEGGALSFSRMYDTAELTDFKAGPFSAPQAPMGPVLGLITEPSGNGPDIGFHWVSPGNLLRFQNDLAGLIGHQTAPDRETIQSCVLIVWYGFAWRADGTHWNNTHDGVRPTPTALTVPLHTPRSASHGGGAHFWAYTVPVMSVEVSRHNRPPRCFLIRFWPFVPQIRLHFAGYCQSPVINGHIA